MICCLMSSLPVFTNLCKLPFTIDEESSDDLKKLLAKKDGVEKDATNRGSGSKDVEIESGKNKAGEKMKEIKDKNDASSNDEPESPPMVSDFEEEDGASSADLDEDIFQGAFAVKDRADPGSGSSAKKDRFDNLPAKAAKILENFEPEVLHSIPEAVSES